MSILLDALRKSENSQKQVEPPTIHGNDHQFEEPQAIKSSYAVILIMVALILIGWLLWKQYDTEGVGYRPPVELPAGKAISHVPAVSDTTETGIPEPEPATSPQESGDTVSARARTPVETYEMSQAEKTAAREERNAKLAAAREQRLAADEQRRREALEQPAAPKPKPSGGQASAKTTTDAVAKRPRVADNEVTATEPATQAKSTKPQTQNYQSPEPQPISYWELPDSVRNGVPEIKFSVLVFAEQPKDRFVLINGERLIEGDELKPGLVVEQIRRDGVVFTYQLYQFFVKR